MDTSAFQSGPGTANSMQGYLTELYRLAGIVGASSRSGRQTFTAALEIFEQMQAMGRGKPDVLFVPCGSGGLTAGSSLAFRTLNPSADIFAVEPENFDDTRRSLEAGERMANTIRTGSICDALLAKIPAPLTFAVNSACKIKVLTVSDDEVRKAMKFAFQYLKIVVEPGGRSD